MTAGRTVIQSGYSAVQQYEINTAGCLQYVNMKSFLYVVHSAPFPHHHFSLFHSLLFICLSQVTAKVSFSNHCSSILHEVERSIALLLQNVSWLVSTKMLNYNKELSASAFFYNWGSINLADGGRHCKNKTHTFCFRKKGNHCV